MTVTLSDPAGCHRDAMALLRSKGLHVARVVDVHTDAVLWLDQAGRPQTTFVEVTQTNTGGLRRDLSTEPGFVA